MTVLKFTTAHLMGRSPGVHRWANAAFPSGPMDDDSGIIHWRRMSICHLLGCWAETSYLKRLREFNIVQYKKITCTQTKQHLDDFDNMWQVKPVTDACFLMHFTEYQAVNYNNTQTMSCLLQKSLLCCVSLQRHYPLSWRGCRLIWQINVLLIANIWSIASVFICVPLYHYKTYFCVHLLLPLDVRIIPPIWTLTDDAKLCCLSSVHYSISFVDDSMRGHKRLEPLCQCR